MTELSDANCRAVAVVVIQTIRAAYLDLLEHGEIPEKAREVLFKAAKSWFRDSGLVNKILDVALKGVKP
jgi:hypothetical protein